MLLLAPQVYGAYGGVPTYLCRLREILTAYSKARGCRLDCISLLDVKEARDSPRTVSTDGSFEGCGGGKAAFVLATARCLMTRRARVAVVGHLGQAPLAWIFQRLGRIRSYIVVLYGIEAWRRVSALDRLAARGARRVVATSRYTAGEFSRWNGIALERVEIIPPAVPDDGVEALEVPRHTGGALSILTVGRQVVAERYKGSDILIEAVQRARASGASLSLSVVGDGDDLPRLRELAARLDVARHVKFLGSVPDETLRELYRECDAFAMPSKGEGFGVVFVEAMRYGKPCIGGRHGGTPEVISHGVDGYLVEYGDVDGLASHLKDLAADPNRRREMGLKGYEKVKSRYVFSRMQSSWFRLLDGLGEG